MYEFECLTVPETEEDGTYQAGVCSPFLGDCYPEIEGCCGPDCNPN